MQPIQLFDLASRQAKWLTVRESVVATNIANANTPKYRAQDVTPFSAVMETTAMPMAATNPAHFTDGFSATQNVETYQTDDPVIMPSDNNVGLANELMKSGEIKRDYDLNTGLVKSFNRLMLLTVKR
jgi:flagellar basal-body rod protein FlgB